MRSQAPRFSPGTHADLHGGYRLNRRIKVLVVDDSSLNRKLLMKAFPRERGATFTQAANGEEALPLLQKRFATFDEKLLAAGFAEIRKGTPRPPVITVKGMPVWSVTIPDNRQPGSTALAIPEVHRAAGTSTVPRRTRRLRTSKAEGPCSSRKFLESMGAPVSPGRLPEPK